MRKNDGMYSRNKKIRIPRGFSGNPYRPRILSPYIYNTGSRPVLSSFFVRFSSLLEKTGKLPANIWIQREPLKAVRQYCLYCANNQPIEIKKCPSKNCPFYFFRFGKNETKPRKTTLKAIKEFCLDCAGNKGSFSGFNLFLMLPLIFNRSTSFTFSASFINTRSI